MWAKQTPSFLNVSFRRLYDCCCKSYHKLLPSYFQVLYRFLRNITCIAHLPVAKSTPTTKTNEGAGGVRNERNNRGDHLIVVSDLLQNSSQTYELLVMDVKVEVEYW